MLEAQIADAEAEHGRATENRDSAASELAEAEADARMKRNLLADLDGQISAHVDVPPRGDAYAEVDYRKLFYHAMELRAADRHSSAAQAFMQYYRREPRPEDAALGLAFAAESYAQLGETRWLAWAVLRLRERRQEMNEKTQRFLTNLERQLPADHFKRYRALKAKRPDMVKAVSLACNTLERRQRRFDQASAELRKVTDRLADLRAQLRQEQVDRQAAISQLVDVVQDGTRHAERMQKYIGRSDRAHQAYLALQHDVAAAQVLLKQRRQ